MGEMWLAAQALTQTPLFWVPILIGSCVQTGIWIRRYW